MRNMSMRNIMLVAGSAVAIASPALGADLPITRYGEAPTYQREVQTYEYREAPPVAVEQRVVVRRRVVVAPPPVVVEEYPIYAAPRFYAGPRVYAYGGPVWRGYGGQRHFRGRW